MALLLAGLALSGGAGVRTAPLGLALSLSPNALAGSSLLLVVAAFSMERAVAAAAVLAGGSLLLASPAPHWASQSGGRMSQSVAIRSQTGVQLA